MQLERREKKKGTTSKNGSRIKKLLMVVKNSIRMFFIQLVNFYIKTTHAPKELQDTCLKYSFSFANFILELSLGFFKKIQIFIKCSLHNLSFYSNIPCSCKQSWQNQLEVGLLATFHSRALSLVHYNSIPRFPKAELFSFFFSDISSFSFFF